VASVLWTKPSPANPEAREVAAEGLPIATLAAVADTIVPADRDPGALDAGIPDLILDALRSDADLQALYRGGLALVEARAKERGASSFSALDAVARERILSSLAGRAEERGGLAARFYRQVRADVLSRYWASEPGQRAAGYDHPAGGYPLPGRP